MRSSWKAERCSDPRISLRVHTVPFRCPLDLSTFRVDMSRPSLVHFCSGMRGSEHRLSISDLSLNVYGRSLFRQGELFFRIEITIHFQDFSSDIMLDFFLSSDKEHVCYMILLSFLELTSYKIAVADLLLSWQSHRKQRAVSSVHCIPEVSSQFLKKRSDGTSPAANPTGAKRNRRMHVVTGGLHFDRF
jgi:hypothetical protein